MPHSTPHGSHRKNFAVKHADGEPLTRVDLQHDMLHHIFSNPLAVFTDPYPTLDGQPAYTKVTFRDLYVNCLVHSSKCSTKVGTQIKGTPQFGTEFAKISLLSNVGRINTTMAFFPGMRTTWRTYHPVPSLQKTRDKDCNLQDAPRIKNILNMCEHELGVSEPAQVLLRSRASVVPPTSIVNLIFIFASNPVTIAKEHFNLQFHYDFLDIFTPIHVSSESRARAFLWLCYHYYEAPSPNPFSDAFAEHNPGKIPALVALTPEQAALENIDTQEEKDMAETMTNERKTFVESQAEAQDNGRDGEATKPRARVRTKRKKDIAEAPPNLTMARTTPDGSSSIVHPDKDVVPSDHPFHSSFLVTQRPLHKTYASEPQLRARALADPYPQRVANTESQYSVEGKASRTRMHKPRERPSQRTTPEPYLHPPPYLHPAPTRSIYSPSYATAPYVPFAVPAPRPVRPLPGHSMLDHAWHVAMTTDPLMNSDDEDFADESTRRDYVLRLSVINRLRGKPPTPEPQYLPPISSILPGLV